MYKNFNITLDVNKDVKNDDLFINTNDLKTVKLSFNLKQSDQALDITGATARLAVEKPDKTTVFQDCTITDAENGQCEVILDTQAYLKHGMHKAEVMIYYTADTVAVTGKFLYIANKGVLDDSSVVSTNEYQSITQAIADTEAILTDLRENGTGVDAEARDDIQTLTGELAQIVTLSVENFKTSSNTYQDAINNTLNASGNALLSYNICKIIFPNKHITINSGFKITSNTIIDLNGCVLKKDNVDDFHVFSTDETLLENVSIINGTVDGNDLNVTGTVNGRFFLGATENKNILIDNVKVINNKSYIVSMGNSKDITIQHCEFINENEDNGAVGLLIYLPNTQGNKRIRILNNYLYNLYGDNIVIGGAPDNYMGSDCIISGNIIEKPCSSSTLTGNRLGAIQCESGSSSESIGFENVVISHNIIKNMDASGDATDAIHVGTVKKAVVTDNIINGTHYGITVMKSEVVNIANNIIEETQRHGIQLTYAKGVININNNSIINPSYNNTSGVNAGIYYGIVDDLNYSQNNVMINNNYVLLSTSSHAETCGIWVHQMSTPLGHMGNVTIKDNEIDNRLNNVFSLKLDAKSYLNYEVKNNRGWVTENEGTAIIPTGTDVIAFDHGLVTAPSIVSLIGSSTEVTDLYVSNLTWNANTQLRIKNKTSVTTDQTIYWKAEVKY